MRPVGPWAGDCCVIRLALITLSCCCFSVFCTRYIIPCVECIAHLLETVDAYDLSSSLEPDSLLLDIVLRSIYLWSTKIELG